MRSAPTLTSPSSSLTSSMKDVAEIAADMEDIRVPNEYFPMRKR
jgi:hypothetical protein